jgi:hypothetical protein
MVNFKTLIMQCAKGEEGLSNYDTSQHSWPLNGNLALLAYLLLTDAWLTVDWTLTDPGFCIDELVCPGRGAEGPVLGGLAPDAWGATPVCLDVCWTWSADWPLTTAWWDMDGTTLTIWL